MNQCLYEYDASFFERQSHSDLLEFDRDEEESYSSVHVHHQKNSHRRSEFFVSLRKRHDRSNSFARHLLSASAQRVQRVEHSVVSRFADSASRSEIIVRRTIQKSHHREKFQHSSFNMKRRHNSIEQQIAQNAIHDERISTTIESFKKNIYVLSLSRIRINH